MRYSILTTVAELSQDLKYTGAPEWTYNLGRILGATLVAGIVLWLGIRAIKKVLNWGKDSKVTGVSKPEEKEKSELTSKKKDKK